MIWSLTSCHAEAKQAVSDTLALKFKSHPVFKEPLSALARCRPRGAWRTADTPTSVEAALTSHWEPKRARPVSAASSEGAGRRAAGGAVSRAVPLGAASRWGIIGMAIPPSTGRMGNPPRAGRATPKRHIYNDLRLRGISLWARPDGPLVTPLSLATL